MADNVRAVIYNDQNQFLVVTELDDPDSWKLPGGKTENGEDPVEAIKRELQEELGFKPEGELHFKELRTDDGFSTRFIFKIEAFVEQIRPNPQEIAETQWVDLASVPVCQNRNHILAAVKSVS
jgi:mutator protein MutT